MGCSRREKHKFGTTGKGAQNSFLNMMLKIRQEPKKEGLVGDGEMFGSSKMPCISLAVAEAGQGADCQLAFTPLDRRAPSPLFCSFLPHSLHIFKLLIERSGHLMDSLPHIHLDSINRESAVCFAECSLGGADIQWSKPYQKFYNLLKKFNNTYAKR